MSVTSNPINAYFEQQHALSRVLKKLREIALGAGLTEELKWGRPTYSWNGRNILGLSLFKEYCGIWFFQGALLSDSINVLQNAQEGKTRALRHWKIYDEGEFHPQWVAEYVKEAVQNEKSGRRIAAERPNDRSMPPIPELLLARFDEDASLREKFEGLSPSSRKEYLKYIAEAKREATRERRIEKILPMIRSGRGLHDQYRT